MINLNIPSKGSINFGNHTQEFRHARRWAINPSWLSQLKVLNPQSLNKSWDIEIRRSVLHAVTNVVMDHLGKSLAKDIAVLIDWDAYQIDCVRMGNYRGETQALMYFICSNEDFELKDWAPEPELAALEQDLYATHGIWKINPGWLVWAYRECKFEQVALTRPGYIPKRLEVLNLLKLRLGKMAGVGAASVGAMIDWETFELAMDQDSRTMHSLNFMCNLPQLDLVRYGQTAQVPITRLGNGLNAFQGGVFQHQGEQHPNVALEQVAGPLLDQTTDNVRQETQSIEKAGNTAKESQENKADAVNLIQPTGPMI